ncbi:hypothetical protein KCP77_00410 [Salmonella enterica subsp. enterica]|nr:hypothetical protein KCP77_00410 [Salmonella enterica subsp. enterica]
MPPKRRNRFAVFRCSYRFRERMPSSNCTFIQFDAVRGNILHLPKQFHVTFCWKEFCITTGKGILCAASRAQNDIIHCTPHKERAYLQRSQSSMRFSMARRRRKRATRSKQYRPVITAHGVRQVENALDVATHIIAPYECLRGAVITVLAGAGAYSTAVSRRGRDKR